MTTIAFWYRNDLASGAGEFIVVDAVSGLRRPAFDHQKLAASLSKAAHAGAYSANKLPFDSIDFAADGKSLHVEVDKTTWKCELASYECTKIDGKGVSKPAAAELGTIPAGAAPPRSARRGEKIPADREPRGFARPTASGKRRSRSTTSSSARRVIQRRDSPEHRWQGGPRLQPLVVVRRIRRHWSPFGSSLATRRRST